VCSPWLSRLYRVKAKGTCVVQTRRIRRLYRTSTLLFTPVPVWLFALNQTYRFVCVFRVNFPSGTVLVAFQRGCFRLARDPCSRRPPVAYQLFISSRCADWLIQSQILLTPVQMLMTGSASVIGPYYWLPRICQRLILILVRLDHVDTPLLCR
jgi:hypothetical protein